MSSCTSISLQSLPTEIRLEIYRAVIHTTSQRLDVDPITMRLNKEEGGSMEYDYRAIPLALRVVSKDICHEFEKEIIAYLQQQRFTTYTEIKSTEPRFAAPLSRLDDPVCVPEDLSHGRHRSIVWYPRTWYGLGLALAIEGVHSQQAKPWSRLSLNVERLNTVLMDAWMRIDRGILPCKIGEPLDLDFIIPHIRQFVYNAAMHISVTGQIHVQLRLPEFRTAYGQHIYSLVHDLRLIADNNFAVVKVYIIAQTAVEPWLQWFTSVGGRVTWYIGTT